MEMLQFKSKFPREVLLCRVNSVRLPRRVSDKRHFCGTALVEFSEEDEAKGVFENKFVFAGADLEIRPKQEFDADREVKKEAYEKSHASKNGPGEGYQKGLILAFKLKKIPADVDTEQNGGDKVDDIDGAKKEEASNTTEKSSVGHEEKIAENNGDVSEGQSDGVKDLKGAATGETAQSIDKDDKSPLDTDEDTISREDIKEEFTKFGTVRVVGAWEQLA